MCESFFMGCCEKVSSFTHGVLFGYYEPNYPHDLAMAASELLGRFRQHYPSLAYFDATSEQKEATAGWRLNGAPFLARNVMINETKPTSAYTRATVLEAVGMLFLIQDGEGVWYWLGFVPARDWEQYSPTFLMMFSGMTLHGTQIRNLAEKSGASPTTETPASTGELPASEIAKKALPSVVILTMQDSAGRHAKLGSGFFVGDGIVATNFHVIEGARRGSARLVGSDTSYQVSGTVAIDEQHDLALLAVSGSNAPVLPVSAGTNLATGDTIYVVGNPEGLEGTFSQGIISSFRKLEEETELLQITAPISQGSSGGPVLNRMGQVVGIAVFTWKEGQNLNFAVPGWRLTDLLRNTGPVRPLTGVVQGRKASPQN